jgi:hypothetical protein
MLPTAAAWQLGEKYSSVSFALSPMAALYFTNLCKSALRNKFRFLGLPGMGGLAVG